MTAFTTLSLLTNVVYGTASGNYDGSSQDFLSDAVPAVNYYSGQGSLQTITYRLQDFVGEIVLEATLNDLPEQAKWFEISRQGNEIDATTGTFPVSITGNFVWVRARVLGFDAGTIQAVTIAY